MQYIMSDIHGAWKRFQKMLKLTNIDLSTDYLYINGDVVDRGIGSIRLLFEIYQMQQEYGDHLVITIGNHELFLLEYINGSLEESLYDYWGGGDTIREYKELNLADREKLKMILKGLPIDIDIESPIRGKMKIIHNGLHPDHIVYNDDGTINVNESVREGVEWDKHRFLINGFLQRDAPARIYMNLDTPMIVGHVPTMYLEDVMNPVIAVKPGERVFMIDCGAGHRGGRLGCLRIEDEQFFYT